MRALLLGLTVAACHSSSSQQLDHSGSAEPPVARPESHEVVTFESDGMTLHGHLWRPAGAGPFPAIVYNHGSEELAGSGRLTSRFFLDHGFIVFYPHRRGQGASHDAAPYMAGLFDPGIPADGAKVTEELVRQSDDVVAGISYLAQQPDVDATRIAVMGCSFGGIETVLAAARSTQLVAAVDFAGASQAWAGNPSLQAAMIDAAKHTRVPEFFIQAENDYDTTPSKVLAAAAGGRGRVHIFPPKGVSAREGHGFCGSGEAQWGDEVLVFLAELMPIVP